MKFLVNGLPYYEADCMFESICEDSFPDAMCPRHWSKDKVCSDENPHECNYLMEWTFLKYSNEKEKY